MARRTVGVEWVEIEERVHHSLYVQGPLSDSSPYTALLWTDLRRACRRMRIHDHQLSVFEWHLRGLTISDILQVMPTETVRDGGRWVLVENTAERVKHHIRDTKRRLRDCPEMGMITAVFEDCGGWSAVRELLNEL